MVISVSPALRSVVSSWIVRVILGLGIIASAVALSVAVSIATGNELLSALVLVLFVAGLGMIVESWRHGGSATAYGLSLHKHTMRHVGIGAGFAVLMLAILASLVVALGGTFIVAQPLPALDVVTLHVARLVVGAASEEVLFRGTMVLAIAMRFGNPAAIVASSALFAVGHVWNPGGVEVLAVVNVFLAGVLLGTMVLNKASLLMAISFHALWNIITSIFFGNVSGLSSSASLSALSNESIAGNDLWLVSGPFGIEQGLATTVVLILAIVMLYRWQGFDAIVVAARNRSVIAERAFLSASRTSV